MLIVVNVDEDPWVAFRVVDTRKGYRIPSMATQGRSVSLCMHCSRHRGTGPGQNANTPLPQQAKR
jgi:hypothetical protein